MDNNQTEMVVQPLQQQSKLFMTDCGSNNVFEFYMTGEIGNPEEYTELCHALRSASPEDLFVIRINSHGGQVRTGDMIINAIKECKCEVVGFIEHHCMSMATFIFLACDSWGLSDTAEFMAHTSSSGSFGKEPETYASAEFLRRQTHKRLRKDYKGFLTDDEIEEVLKGIDIYLDAEEVQERIEVFAEYRKEQYEQDGEDQPEDDLTSILQSAVETSVRNIMDEYGMKPKKKVDKKTKEE